MIRLLTLYQAWKITASRPGAIRTERGSVTMEHVMWAVAVIAIVAIVVAAVKAYVTSQAGQIK
jgi:heme/copper-type cytochrome/quinol oxidase subunit 2